VKKKLKILIVSENATDNFGGESVLPLHYFRELYHQGEDVWLITHVRVKERLEEIIPECIDNIIFIPETWLHKFLYEMGKKLPARIDTITTHALSHLITQFYQLKLSKNTIKHFEMNVVHVPAPVSPMMPSVLFNLGVPVVIGPMNGGMTFPVGFAYMQNVVERYAYSLIRILGHFINMIIPGKLFANTLLVANERTRRALPRFTFGKIDVLVENAVGVSLLNQSVTENDSESVSFIFVGRLVDWKCCDLLIKAFATLSKKYQVSLTIVGDGEELNSLKALADELETKPAITFKGWLSPSDTQEAILKSNVLVLPSVRECGGAVVLEAMSVSKPVIAVNWGGPADYITDETGILLDPVGPNELVDQLSVAMEKMIINPAQRKKYGQAGYKRVIEHFTWSKKIERIKEIYRVAIDDYSKI